MVPKLRKIISYVQLYESQGKILFYSGVDNLLYEMKSFQGLLSDLKKNSLDALHVLLYISTMTFVVFVYEMYERWCYPIYSQIESNVTKIMVCVGIIAAFFAIFSLLLFLSYATLKKSAISIEQVDLKKVKELYPKEKQLFKYSALAIAVCTLLFLIFIQDSFSLLFLVMMLLPLAIFYALILQGFFKKEEVIRRIAQVQQRYEEEIGSKTAQKQAIPPFMPLDEDLNIEKIIDEFGGKSGR